MTKMFIVLRFNKTNTKDFLNYHFCPEQKLKQLNFDSIQVKFTSGKNSCYLSEIIQISQQSLQKTTFAKNRHKAYLKDVLNKL